MRVVCTNNRGDNLPKHLWNEAMGLSKSTHFHITIGSEYVVYAITLFLGDIWYYICDDSYKYFPVWHPACLFRVVDPRLSATWQYVYDPVTDSSDEAMLLGFREWATDHGFYERLTEGDPDAVGVFRRYKTILDSEFL